jgi:hypothetical protein
LRVKLNRIAPIVILITALSAGRVSAQASVTSADVQRIQDNIFEASRDISQARTRDAALATQLQAELDDARDESIYLKVKLRKNEPIARSEYSDLRDRIENIRSRARGDASGGYTPPANPSAGGTSRPSPSRPASTSSSRPMEIPTGTEFDVRLQRPLSSATAQVEDRIEATTVVDLRAGDQVLVPTGSVMRGIVKSVNKAGRVDRKGSLTLAFDQITVGAVSYPIRGTVSQALESEGIKGEAARIGTGAGVGAMIGGILGGIKGALAGILIGGGGTIAATEGQDVSLPTGTVLRVRLDSVLDLR